MYHVTMELTACTVSASGGPPDDIETFGPIALHNFILGEIFSSMYVSLTIVSFSAIYFGF